MTLWGLATAGHCPQALLKALPEHLKGHERSLGAQGLPNVLWALAKLDDRATVSPGLVQGLQVCPSDESEDRFGLTRLQLPFCSFLQLDELHLETDIYSSGVHSYHQTDMRSIRSLPFAYPSSGGSCFHHAPDDSSGSGKHGLCSREAPGARGPGCLCRYAAAGCPGCNVLPRCGGRPVGGREARNKQGKGSCGRAPCEEGAPGAALLLSAPHARCSSFFWPINRTALGWFSQAEDSDQLPVYYLAAHMPEPRV